MRIVRSLRPGPNLPMIPQLPILERLCLPLSQRPSPRHSLLPSRQARLLLRRPLRMRRLAFLPDHLPRLSPLPRLQQQVNRHLVPQLNLPLPPLPQQQQQQQQQQQFLRLVRLKNSNRLPLATPRLGH